MCSDCLSSTRAPKYCSVPNSLTCQTSLLWFASFSFRSDKFSLKCFFCCKLCGRYLCAIHASTFPLSPPNSVKMGAHHSKTPSPAAPASPNTTLQATSPSRACAEAKFYETPPVQSGVSKSSSSRMQGTMLSHTCLRRRRRRGRKGGKQLHRLPVALSVGNNGINDGDGDDSVALRVGGKLVGESVLVYWQKISAWFVPRSLKTGFPLWCTRGSHIDNVTKICFSRFVLSQGGMRSNAIRRGGGRDARDASGALCGRIA